MLQEVSLMDMLDFRERKAGCLQRLKTDYPNAVIITLGMNIPGPHKTGPDINLAFCAGCRKISEVLNTNGLTLVKEESCQETAGYIEYYVVESEDVITVKRLMVEIEDTHPVGRLFDIDVYRADGSGISRKDISVEERKCLICGNSAKACGRSRTHSVEELEAKVKEIIKNYSQQEV